MQPAAAVFAWPVAAVEFDGAINVPAIYEVAGHGFTRGGEPQSPANATHAADMKAATKTGGA